MPRDSILPHAIGVGVGGSATELRHVIHAYRAAVGADIVHDHTLIGPVYADRFAGLPVVTTNHGPFQSELGDYYQALAEGTRIIAICLLNSIDWPEPFGMVMVEALAFGTPVMATHMGAAPEIVADGITGFIRSTQKDLSLGLSRHRKTSTAARVEPP